MKHCDECFKPIRWWQRAVFTDELLYELKPRMVIPFKIFHRNCSQRRDRGVLATHLAFVKRHERVSKSKAPETCYVENPFNAP